MSIIQGCHETTPLCETTNVIQRISPEYSPSSSLYHPLVDSIPKGKKNSQTDTWIISHFIPNLVWGCSGYVKAMFDASINCCTSHLSMIKSLLFIVESPAVHQVFWLSPRCFMWGVLKMVDPQSSPSRFQYEIVHSWLGWWLGVPWWQNGNHRKPPNVGDFLWLPSSKLT